MTDYTEHVISMAGGDGGIAEAIATVADRVENGTMRPDDRRDLSLILALVKEQQAEIKRYAEEDAAAFVARNVANTQANLRTTIREQAAKLEAVEALAADWELRGEYDMAYSKTIEDEIIALEILQSGAQMVDDARLIRTALGAGE